MKGLAVSILSVVSLMLSSCFGCTGCINAQCGGNGCGTHNNGYCDSCGTEYGVEQVTELIELCPNCMDNPDYDSCDVGGCGGCMENVGEILDGCI